MTPRHATCDAQLTRAETIVSIPDQEIGGLEAALEVSERAAASARGLFATDPITQDAI